MYEHVMVLLDGSELGECVLPHFEAMAGANLVRKATLLAIEEPIRIPSELERRLDIDERKRVEESRLESSRVYLDKIASRLNYEGTVVETVVLHGNIAPELTNYLKTKRKFVTYIFVKSGIIFA